MVYTRAYHERPWYNLLVEKTGVIGGQTCLKRQSTRERNKRWQNILSADLICDNVIVRTLANISKCSIGLILSKYCIQSISINTNDIKLRMWKHFVDDCAEHGRVTFYWAQILIWLITVYISSFLDSWWLCCVVLYCLIMSTVCCFGVIINE